MTARDATGMELPEICFGTMRFAARTPGDDAQSRAGQRVLEEALDLGIDFVHSSYEYGTRWSTGQVLAKHPHRDRVRHAIKVRVPDGGERRFDPVAFRRQVEDAPSELRADRIDVVQHLQHLQRGDFERRLGYDDRAAPHAGDRMLDPGGDRAYDHLAAARAIVAPEIGEGRTEPYWTSFALKFALVDPLIASAVVSINTPEPLHEVLAALEGPRPDPAPQYER